MATTRLLSRLILLFAVAAALPAFADDVSVAPITDQPSALVGSAPQMTLAPRDFKQPSPTADAACCKICSNGKACGNSCISRKKTCHKPPGCACDAQ